MLLFYFVTNGVGAVDGVCIVDGISVVLVVVGDGVVVIVVFGRLVNFLNLLLGLLLVGDL